MQSGFISIILYYYSVISDYHASYKWVDSRVPATVDIEGKNHRWAAVVIGDTS